MSICHVISHTWTKGKRYLKSRLFKNLYNTYTAPAQLLLLLLHNYCAAAAEQSLSINQSIGQQLSFAVGKGKKRKIERQQSLLPRSGVWELTGLTSQVFTGLVAEILIRFQSVFNILFRKHFSMSKSRTISFQSILYFLGRQY